MAENTKLTSLELNGVRYGLGRSIYAELDMSLERFVELLGRDFYCPTLAAAPTSSTITYKDTDDSVNTFQIGQPCRWQEGSAWRLAVCTNNTGSAATWYILPAKVSELTNDAGYLTSHQDISHLATKQEVNAKQDAISDLATIRENASKGATALQSVPSEYVTETELANKGYATSSSLNSGLSGKVDKVNGKQLSTEDFTTALKNKLSGLSNYDDATITDAVNKLRGDFDTLVSGDTTSAIESFNEIVAFLEGVQDSGTLEGIVAGINQEIAKKQDKISDLDTIRLGAAKGATALQTYTETDPVFSASAAAGIKSSDITNWNSKTSNTGTITGIKMNGASKGTSGVVDLGTVITAHQDISGKVDKVSGKGLSTNDYTTDEKNKLGGISAGAEVNVQSDWNVTDATSDAYIKNKPTIPAAVTESTVSGWGFTKNTGTYSKPSTGIPKTDLASAVRTSLEKADTALQSYTETDPIFLASAAAGIKASDITNWNSKTSNTGTITGIKMNGTSKGTSGVVDLGTVITAHQDISGKLDKTTASSTYLTKTDASSTYLGKTAKAVSATSADSATKATQDASGNIITSTYATKLESNAKQDKNVYFTDVSASSWVTSTTYTDYGYQCDISCSGVTASMYAEVVFDPSQATSGNYAPVCETFTDKVRIYSKVNKIITIPTILIEK